MPVVPPWLLLALGVSWLAPPQVAAPLPSPLTAERLLEEVRPEALEVRLEADRALVEPALVALADGLASSDEATARRVAEYLAAGARARGRRLAAAMAGSQGGELDDARLDALVTLLLVHPGRFAADRAFRARVLAFLPEALGPEERPALRDRVLTKLNQVDGFDFAAAEALEVAWGAVPRASAERRLPEEVARAVVFDDDVTQPLAASIYSLPSAFFEADEARRFLAAVRRIDPGREVLVLTDLPLTGGPAGLTLLPTHGRAYSPWPRDPMSLVHRPDGGVAVVVRPNAQPGREEDAFLGRELVQTLPERLDGAWGRPGWTVAPVPFHNGQVLLAPDAAWITLHGVELRALEILGLGRVPVEDFGRAEGVDRYMTAVQKAASELAALYGRPVRFGHPLPADFPAGDRPALMARLGGGAGYDLDSLVTLLPGPVALVADPRLGRELLTALPRGDWEGFRTGFDLAPAAERLPSALAAALDEPPAAALADFLDLVAGHLAAQGFAVERLPLLVVPTALLADREGVSHRRFLITWNNVVVETRGGRVRAEGFASLLPAADRRVAAAFRRAGARLDLVPPLVRSVVLVGGYRCASSHLRQAGR